jgi:hypothetical protein
MTGGEISGNSAIGGSGGGVFVRGADGGFHAIFEMSGGTVGGNAAGYGKDVAVQKGNVSMVSFIMSAAAQAERVFLDSTQSITIGGPLTGNGTTVIDLGIENSQTITDWVGARILKPNSTYKARFTLGQTVMITGTITATDIPATYTILNNGRIE